MNTRDGGEQTSVDDVQGLEQMRRDWQRVYQDSKKTVTTEGAANKRLKGSGSSDRAAVPGIVCNCS